MSEFLNFPDVPPLISSWRGIFPISHSRSDTQSGLSEDGVLPEWFRHPHPNFGTTHRIINLVVGLQLLTILLSGGAVYVLGEAYAFGVLWTFVLQSLAVWVLRYTEPGPREFRVPLNFRFRGVEIPFGLGIITLILLGIAVTNLVTKPSATISGITFSVFLFVVFTASEKFIQRRSTPHPHVDEFRLIQEPNLSPETTLAAGPGAYWWASAITMRSRTSLLSLGRST